MFHRFADNREHQGSVYALAWSEDQRSFYSGSGDGFVVKRDALTMEMEETIRVGEAVFAIWEDEVRKRLWIGTQSGSIRIIDLHGRKEVKHIQQHTQGIFRFIKDPHSAKLYALGGDGVLSLWLLDELAPERLIPLGCGKLRDLVFLPHANQIAVA
ncbi:MAG: WD40 repeat domain-containing protein, partial [Flavobacteriales bacterium]